MVLEQTSVQDESLADESGTYVRYVGLSKLQRFAKPGKCCGGGARWKNKVCVSLISSRREIL